nr:pentatricopeptide repeat-containing protein At1g71060, mitochondrial [Tanacetum cinerariifolium]
MKTKRVLEKSTFLIISRRYARAKKAKEALEAFERMKVFGFKAELDDFNRFFDVLCKARLVGTACNVFD